MDNIAYIIIGLEGVLFVAAVILLIYLVFRRIKLKRLESFEKRDN